MPEVILPCTASMNDAELLKLKHRFDDVCQSSTTPELFELCRAGSHLVDSIRTLPRALPWTHEPPKVAGWYWYQLDGHAAEPRKIDSSFDGEEYLGVRDGWYVNRITKKPHVKWAGPIAPPVD